MKKCQSCDRHVEREEGGGRGRKKQSADMGVG